MTTNGIISVARRFINDTIAPYRWEDSELKADVQFAVRELNKIRPETRYVGGVLTDGVTLPTSNTDQIAVDDRYEECIAYYVAYLAYLDDNSDTVNAQLAESYLNKFNVKAQL